VSVAIAFFAVVMVAVTPLAADASTKQISLSKKCNNAADITDNGRDVWLLCQGLSATASNSIEIAVNSGKVIADIASPKGVVIPTEITSNDNYVWIESGVGQGDVIAQYATPSGKLVRLISGSEINQPLAIAATPSTLWVTTQLERDIVQISASSGRVTHAGAAGEFDQGSSVATSDSYVWVLNQAQKVNVPSDIIYSVTQLTSGGTVVRTIDLCTFNAETQKSMGLMSPPDAITATPTGVWVDSAETDAIEIDDHSGRVLRNLKNLPSFGTKNGPHLMFVSGNRMWLAGSIPALYELNASTGDVINTSKVMGTFNSGGFYGIAGDAKNIWVMNSSVGQVAEFRRSDDALVRAYS
jgi:hypothetical protein